MTEVELISVYDGSLLVNTVVRYPVDTVVDSNTLVEALHEDAMSNNGLVDNSLLIDFSATVATSTLDYLNPGHPYYSL